VLTPLTSMGKSEKSISFKGRSKCATSLEGKVFYIFSTPNHYQERRYQTCNEKSVEVTVSSSVTYEHMFCTKALENTLCPGCF
jgi:hypothetical protein